MTEPTVSNIADLKAKWLADPCWDIENTEGFEKYYGQLLAFRIDQEMKWKEERDQKHKAQAQEVTKQTGVAGELADILYSFSNIENSMNLDEMVGDGGSAVDLADYMIAKAQVRATLLLAAQVKRIADVLENMDARENQEETVRIWGTGE